MFLWGPLLMAMISEYTKSVGKQSTRSNISEEPEKPAQGYLFPDEAEPAQDGHHLSPDPQDHGRSDASTPGSFNSDSPRPNGKHKRRDDESGDERQPKKRRPSSSLTDDSNDVQDDNQTESHYNDTTQEAQAPEQQVDDQALPPLEPRSRSRSKERHRKPNESRSRNSSVSSRSSDLNSLEAELLGRPLRREDRQQDRLPLSKIPRRRQQNADSAYR